MRHVIKVAACVCALAFPSAVLAKTTPVAPPGNSGVDQYVETLPGAGGVHPTGGSGGSGGSGVSGGSGGSGGGSGQSSVPASTQRRLASQGAAGQAVNRIAASTAPKRPGQSTVAPSPGGTTGRDPASGVLHSVFSSSGNGGVGIVLPLFLVASLVIATAAALLRRRRRRRPTPQTASSRASAS